MLKRYWKFIKNMSLRGWILIGTVLFTTFISGATVFKFYDKSYTRGYWNGWNDAADVVKQEFKKHANKPVLVYEPDELDGFRVIKPLPPKRLRNLIHYQSADTTVYNEIK